MVSTKYCSKNCQTTDWPKHKDACLQAKHRKHLYRAGDVLHSIFLNFREVAYDIPLLRIEKTEDGKLHLYEGTENEDHILVEFPVAMMSDEEDKRATLCYHACDEALVHMHKMVVKMLEGSATKIDEVTVRLKDEQQPIVFHNLKKSTEGESGDAHEQLNLVTCPGQIFRVKLKHGHSYAIDLAGAQYGQYLTVLPMNDYLREHSVKIMSVNALGDATWIREEQISGRGICVKPSVEKTTLLTFIMDQMSLDRQTPKTGR